MFIATDYAALSIDFEDTKIHVTLQTSLQTNGIFGHVYCTELHLDISILK